MNRKPAVAGTFYPNEPSLLRRQIEKFMLPAKTKPSCVGVISPHAGYTYSGLTAAYAINSLKPAKSFIILGPNHTGAGRGGGSSVLGRGGGSSPGSKFSLMSGGRWSTPLGDVPINERLAAELMRRTDIFDDAGAHLAEHSIEVQLPFIQHLSRHSPAWKAYSDFSFVPVCIMNTGYDDVFLEACVSTGEIIADIIGKRNSGDIGIIASSDFSHYVAPDSIEKREKQIVKAIMELDVPKFFDALSGSDASVCGFGPIAVLMAAAKKLGLSARDIHSSNSGGDKAVSYRAIGFE